MVFRWSADNLIETGTACADFLEKNLNPICQFMRNEAADIVQDQLEETPEWKAKAKVAGTAAMDASRAACKEIHDRTLEYTKVTDQAIRQSPYKALGIVFGVGCFLGFLLTRSKRVECED